jgi:hypothetical protein
MERSSETREGWRRFGDPSPMRVERGTESERRTETRSSVDTARPQSSERTTDSNWRRFGEGSAGDETRGASRIERQAGTEGRSESRVDRSDTWRRDWPARGESRSEGRSEVDRSQPSVQRWGGGDTVRTSPPIVRERSVDQPRSQRSFDQPRSERSFERGSSRMEMPRMERGGGDMGRSEAPRGGSARMERGSGGGGERGSARGGDGGGARGGSGRGR